MDLQFYSTFSSLLNPQSNNNSHIHPFTHIHTLVAIKEFMISSRVNAVSSSFLASALRVDICIDLRKFAISVSVVMDLEEHNLALYSINQAFICLGSVFRICVRRWSGSGLANWIALSACKPLSCFESKLSDFKMSVSFYMTDCFPAYFEFDYIHILTSIFCQEHLVIQTPCMPLQVPEAEIVSGSGAFVDSSDMLIDMQFPPLIKTLISLP